MRTLVVTCLLFFLAGCGTLFNKDMKHLPVTSDPQGADVYVDDVRVATTPDTIRLNNNKSQQLVFRLEGHREAACEVRSSAKAGWVVLDVLFGVFPLVIDAVTGEWKGISDQGCHVSLPPASRDATAVRP